MRVIRAAAMGMCFGVRDAIAITDQIENPADVTIYGELVHNEQVNRKLARRGFITSSELGRAIPATSGVMITAHGVSNSERQLLTNAGKQLIDTTCPLVKRAHDTASALRQKVGMWWSQGNADTWKCWVLLATWTTTPSLSRPKNLFASIIRALQLFANHVAT